MALSYGDCVLILHYDKSPLFSSDSKNKRMTTVSSVVGSSSPDICLEGVLLSPTVETALFSKQGCTIQ